MNTFKKDMIIGTVVSIIGGLVSSAGIKRYYSGRAGLACQHTLRDWARYERDIIEPDGNGGAYVWKFQKKANEEDEAPE